VPRPLRQQSLPADDLPHLCLQIHRGMPLRSFAALAKRHVGPNPGCIAL
jgi:hypothetical protein